MKSRTLDVKYSMIEKTFKRLNTEKSSNVTVTF